MDFSIGKIVTGEKVGNHYFYTGSLTSDEEKEKKPVSPGVSRGGKGTIFWLIELTSDDAKIPKIIAKQLKKYYQQKEDGVWGFEQALKKVNASLALQIQNKNTSWVTHINAVLGLAQDQTVHLAPTGDVSAYLFRENKISNILDVEESPPPHQTFISVISGEVEENDKMFLATSEFTSYMTIETLADFLREHTEKAIGPIAQYFREKNIRDINALTLDFSKTTLDVDSVYLDQRPETGPEKTFKVLNKIKDATFATINATVLAIGKLEYKILINYLAKKRKQREEKQEKETPKLTSSIRIEAGRHVTHLKNIVLDEKRVNFLKKNQRYIFIGLAIILLLVFGLTLYFRTHTSSSDNQNIMTNFNQAKTLVDQAIGEETSNPQDAYNLLAQAKNLNDPAKNYTPTTNDAMALGQKIENEINKITSTTVISSTTDNVGDFTQKGDVATNRIFNLNDQLITFNPKNNQFYSLDPNNKQITDLFNLPSSDGNISDATLFSSNNDYFFIKSDQNKFYTYNFNDKSIKAAAQINTFTWPTNSSRLLSYLDKVYFLEPNQLERSNFSASSFSNLTVSAQSANQIKSCAIDGSIYFLTSDNQVEQYTSGTQNNFSLTKPFFLTTTDTWDSIYTNSNVSYIFIYEKSANRILVFDKTGAYSKQFALPSAWGEVKDMVANSNNQLFVLASNKVYQISY
jgi:hypothetical protein